MLLSKHHSHQDGSPTSSPASSRTLFAEYPYPEITELNKEYKKKKKSSYLPSSLTSLHWHRDNFDKMIGMLQNLHIHRSPSSILEQSFRQAHINGRSSNAIVSSLQKQTKPTRVRRILPSSMRSPINDDQPEETNTRRTRNRLRTKLNNLPINDDQG